MTTTSGNTTTGSSLRDAMSRAVNQEPVKGMKHSALKKPVMYVGLFVALCLIFWVIRSYNGGPVGKKRAQNTQQGVTVSDNDTTGNQKKAGASVLVEVWNPEDIIRKDSMILTNKFQRVAVPDWIMNPSLKSEGERKVEWYAQNIEIKDLGKFGPSFSDPSNKIKWGEWRNMWVRLPPEDNQNKNLGVLYFVLRQKR